MLDAALWINAEQVGAGVPDLLDYFRLAAPTRVARKLLASGHRSGRISTLVPLETSEAATLG